MVPHLHVRHSVIQPLLCLSPTMIIFHVFGLMQGSVYDQTVPDRNNMFACAGHHTAKIVCLKSFDS